MSARPQVTITLGRSGQVVKRARTTSDVSSSDYDPSLDGKRSVRERLGNNLDNQNSFENHYAKRALTLLCVCYALGCQTMELVQLQLSCLFRPDPIWT
ncbi:hypothetical protein HPP92_017697 [Vanilla planifolia]|uniref:Uncharacterized protein n=1 Tax=Vanilla planifolia TaxID=51239 RepID=A0A835UM65_VANPL|nr:hypothetical protein HPP92_017697 [Vanilla planifolia]